MRDFFDRVDVLLEQAHGLFVGCLIMFALSVWACESWHRRRARR